MSNALKARRGFSLPEVLLAMVLLVMVVTALTGAHRALNQGFALWSQYQQLWRYAWIQATPEPDPLPTGWQVKRVQTTQAGCVSINVILTSPLGRQGQITRLHCALSQ